MQRDRSEPPSSLLIVEDHPKVAENLRAQLAREGYAVRTAATGSEALTLLGSERFDLLVLDLTLPDCDGLAVLAQRRAAGDGIRTLILTARDDIADRLRGLDGGADDYLVKPFQMAEVLARIRALLRRAREHDIRRLRVADLELDLITRRASRAGRAIDLAPKEFDLLAYLMDHAGRVVSREMLGREVWTPLVRGTPLDNVIDVHIGRLRKKIDAEAEVPLIRTIRGLGFRVSDGLDR